MGSDDNAKVSGAAAADVYAFLNRPATKKVLVLVNKLWSRNTRNCIQSKIHDAVDRIQGDDSTIVSVCMELQKHLPFQPVCHAAVTQLERFLNDGLKGRTEQEKLCAWKQLFNANGIELVVSAMINHKESSCVVHCSHQFWSTCRSAHVPPKVIPSLFSALKGFPEDGELQEDIFCIIWNITVANEENVFEMVEQVAAALPLALSALRRHPHCGLSDALLVLELFHDNRPATFREFVQNQRDIYSRH